MIEGVISKDDMILMNKKYDTEIDTIKAEIKNIEQINLINSKQADNLQIYIDRINAIVNDMSSTDMEEVLKEWLTRLKYIKTI